MTDDPMMYLRHRIKMLERELTTDAECIRGQQEELKKQDAIIAALREQLDKTPVLIGYVSADALDGMKRRCIKEGPTLIYSHAVFEQPQETGE